MKFWYKLLFLSVFVLALVGCSDDEHESVSLTQYEAEDGKVTQLQKHTIGKGIPIVIMGDRYSKKNIESGWYRTSTSRALEGLFSVHPMKSLREYFDVYEVTAVAYVDIFNKNVPVFTEQDSTGILISSLGEEKAVEYTKKAIGEERIDDAVNIIIVNYNQYFRSICCNASPRSSSNSDIPTGYALAYVWLGDGTQSLSDYYVTLLHEAIGHGFAKLDDEYVEEDKKWYDYDSNKEWKIEEQKLGYDRNISFDSDVTKSCWADFAADSRYDFEKLGCYEGGSHQEKGVYRATENSIMNNCFIPSGFSFNVVGRAMIYKRCMKIAYGDSWEFNYEDFVKFDLEKAKAEYKANQERYPTYSTSKRLGAPPRFVDCVSRVRAVKTTK